MVDVTLVTPGGTSAISAADRYTYTSAPTVARISPATGPVAGSTAVTITGSNLTDVTAVYFGSVAVNLASLVYNADGTIAVPSPGHSAAAVNVTVVTLQGTSAISSADQFTYVAAPTVASVSPAAGPLAGGTSVTIAGADLFKGHGDLDYGGLFRQRPGGPFQPRLQRQWIDHGPRSCPFGRYNRRHGRNVRRHVGDFFGGPVFLHGGTDSNGRGPGGGIGGRRHPRDNRGREPDGRHGGLLRRRRGKRLQPRLQHRWIDHGHQPCSFGRRVPITVTTPGGTSTLSSAFTYMAAPTVSGVIPATGPSAGGTLVTIGSANLSSITAIHIGSVTASLSSLIYNADATITVTMPPEPPGLVDITVVTPGGTSAVSSADQYTYVAAPTVTGVSPAAAPLGGGTLVTLTGANLKTVSEIDFGSVAASLSSLVYNANGTITITSPAHAAGAVDVRVVTPGGTSTISSADQFTYVAAPTVTVLSQTAGPLGGGTPVTITGANLKSITSISFGTVAASLSSLVYNANGTITIASPAHAAAPVDVTVVTPGGTSTLSSADQFTYMAAPTVTGVSAPAAGPLSGGTSLTVNGANLKTISEIDFGSVLADLLQPRLQRQWYDHDRQSCPFVGHRRYPSGDARRHVGHLVGRPLHLRRRAHGDQGCSRSGKHGGRHGGDDHRCVSFGCYGGQFRRRRGEPFQHRLQCQWDDYGN